MQWVKLPLPVEDPDQMATTLREIVRTKEVPAEVARRLGFVTGVDAGDGAEAVEIPMWRHAIVSLRHPLLEDGLVILDTPGLNALGQEPELTLNMLPSAQAILFVLAADTGVTQSDLDMWRQCVHPSEDGSNSHIGIALNKIDTLWDELRDQARVDLDIATQRRRSAEILGMPLKQVFPVSAQKGLVARVRNDGDLLQRSGLPALERFFSDQILPNRMRVLHDHVASRVGSLVNQQLHLFENRQAQIRRELANLQALRGKNVDVIEHLMHRSREEQAAYQKNVQSFRASRQVLQAQAKVMLESLSPKAVDGLIDETRRAMSGAWTTVGLKRGMAAFFEGARRMMDQATLQADQTRTLVRAIYRKFHQDHGLPALRPPTYSTRTHQAALTRLLQEAEAYRNSPVTTMTEQSFVIKRFFISLVSRARDIFFQAHQEAEAWFAEVMNPLVRQINEHRKVMERRLDTLRRISQSRETLEARIAELREQAEAVEADVATLDALRSRLVAPPPLAETGPMTAGVPRPQPGSRSVGG